MQFKTYLVKASTFLRSTAFIYTFGNIMNRISFLFLVPIYARQLPINLFGVYDFLLALFYLFTTIGTFQVDSAIARFFYEKQEVDRSLLVFNGLVIILVSSIVSAILFMFGGGYVVNVFFSSFELNDSLLLISFNIIFFGIYSYLSNLLRFYERPYLFIGISFLQTVLTALFIIFFLVRLKLLINGIFLGMLISNIICVLLLFFIFINSIKFKFKYNDFCSIIKFAGPSLPGAVISWFNGNINKFLMIKMLSVVELGLFASAQKIGALFVLLDISLRMSWQPYFWKIFFEESIESKNDRLLNKFNQILILVGIALVLYLFISPTIFKILFGAKFNQASGLVPLMGIAYCIPIFTNLIVFGPDITSKTYYNSLFVLIASIINIVLIFIFIPIWGIKGVALALTLSNLIGFLIAANISELLYKIGYPVKFIFLAMLVISVVTFLLSL